VATDYMNLIFTHFHSRMDALPLLTDAELRGLTMPVLLLAGARDAVFDSAQTAARLEHRVDRRFAPAHSRRQVSRVPHAIGARVSSRFGHGRIRCIDSVPETSQRGGN
jgi:pimeloyl-ACP methyl ester carboxylesterase